MASLFGDYEHVRDEYMDECFTCVGVPTPIRKMMLMTCPKITIKKNIDNKFLIQTKGSEPASGMIFKLGEEFQEFVKDVSLTNVAVLDEEGSLIIKSTYGGVTATRKYEVENDDEMILTISYENSPPVVKRYFKRVLNFCGVYSTLLE